MNKHAIID